MFFFIINTNNKPACLLSIRLLLDFCWLCLLEFHWTSIGYVHWFWSFLVAGLLLVHWQSIRKVCCTEWSSQKCSDQLQKIPRKILWSKSRKISILLTLSPMESARKSSGSVKIPLNWILCWALCSRTCVPPSSPAVLLSCYLVHAKFGGLLAVLLMLPGFRINAFDYDR